MKWRAARWTFPAAALFALSACVASVPTPGATPVTRFYKQYIAAFNATLQCQTGLAPEYVNAPLREEDELTINELNTAVSAGCIAFDSDRAEICLQTLQAAVRQATANCWGEAPTPFVLTAPEVCSEVLSGTIPLGGSCTSGGCVSGSCSGGVCVAASVAPVRPTAPIGGDCTSAYCIQGSSCTPVGASQICVLNDSCQAASDCTAGLVCNVVPDGSGQGSCSASLAEGAVCDADGDQDACGDGLFCELDINNYPKGICRKQLDAGATCTTSADHLLFESIASAQCRGRQICAGLIADVFSVQTPGHCDVPHDIGGSCTQTHNAATQGCYAGLRCDETNHCAAPEDGEPCARDGFSNMSACDPFTSYCDPQGTCRPLESEGSSCGPEDGEYVCKSYRCQAVAPFGSGECVSPRATLDICGGR